MIKDPEDIQDVNMVVLKSVLGITGTTINKLVRANILSIKPGPRGHYDLTVIIREYLQYRLGGGEEQARNQKYQEEVKKLRMLNAEREGKLVPISDASSLFAEYCASVRAGVTALPGRLSSQLAGMSKPVEIRGLIHAEVTELLDAAETVFAEYHSLAEATGGDAAGVDDPEGATKPDNGTVGRRKSSPAKRKRGTRKVA